MKIPKQAYTIEFKELAVKRIKDGQSVSTVCKELGLAARQLPHIALGSRMFAIETTAIKSGVARRVSRQRLILGGIVAR